MKLITIFLFMFIFILEDGQAQEIDWNVLWQGDVVIESVESSAGVPGVRVLFVVAASREKIWRALLDYDNFTQIFIGVDKLKVLKEDQHGAFVEFWIDAVLKKLHYVLYRKYSIQGALLEWNQVSGDLKAIHGSWRIKDTTLANKKLVIYESYVDIGYSVITWAVRLGAKNKARKMAHRFREWLE